MAPPPSELRAERRCQKRDRMEVGWGLITEEESEKRKRLRAERLKKLDEPGARGPYEYPSDSEDSNAPLTPPRSPKSTPDVTTLGWMKTTHPLLVRDDALYYELGYENYDNWKADVHYFNDDVKAWLAWLGEVEKCESAPVLPRKLKKKVMETTTSKKRKREEDDEGIVVEAPKMKTSRNNNLDDANPWVESATQQIPLYHQNDCKASGSRSSERDSGRRDILLRRTLRRGSLPLTRAEIEKKERGWPRQQVFCARRTRSCPPKLKPEKQKMSYAEKYDGLLHTTNLDGLRH